ncbi:glycosyltransferase [Novosphingobium naphthalenivorans]|uniref:glycosyltransferase n=1 Tax=Novosphingobium naphthalenivorans TaxID=273168 RepID=UPI00082BB249|nr:glycosyltransferase [Novosphingobium naphthalenivorans]
MSSDTPRLTIITVVRNNLQGLITTSNSVLDQSFTSWELIIKDGSSNDGTCEYAEELMHRDPRIRLVTDPDKSIYDAMNVALSHAVGDYTLMLNGGDFLVDSSVLDEAFALLDAIETPVDIAFFATRCRFEGGRSATRRARRLSYIKYGLPAIHQSTLFSTAWHKRFPYDLSYPICGDYVTIASQIKEGARAQCFDFILSEFEICRDSTSFAGRARSRIEMDRALRELWAESWATRKLKAARRYLSNLAVQLLVATNGLSRRR